MSLVALFAAASATVAQPIDDPRSWITAKDYPASALKAGDEGPVRVILSIDSSGHIADCNLQLSSGNAGLDNLTCELFRKRARFSPARNSSGTAVASHRVQQVRWAIPRERLISQGFRMTYGLSSTGKITGCKIDEFGGHDPDLTCSSQMIEKVAQIYLSNPLDHYSALSLLLAMQIDDDTKINILRTEGGERKIITHARIRVSSDGVIIECVTNQVAHYDGRSLDLCKEVVQVGQKEFEPDRSGLVRLLTVSFELTGTPR